MKEINGQPHFLTREVASRMGIKFNTFKNMLSGKGIFTGMYPTQQYEHWFTISNDYVPQLKKTFPTTYWPEWAIKKVYEMFNRPYLQENPIIEPEVTCERPGYIGFTGLDDQGREVIETKEDIGFQLSQEEEDEVGFREPPPLPSEEEEKKFEDDYNEATDNPNW